MEGSANSVDFIANLYGSGRLCFTFTAQTPFVGLWACLSLAVLVPRAAQLGMSLRNGPTGGAAT